MNAIPFAMSGASPHTRGWTCFAGCMRGQVGGFPAHAGMDRSYFACLTI